MSLYRIFAAIIMLYSFTAQAQTCIDAIPAVTPDSRFTDHGDGTVTDNATGLMWKQCSEGQSGADCAIASATTYTWQGALQRVETVNTSGGFAGYSDWRLPNFKELTSLVEEKCYLPAINVTLFPNTQSLDYWSSSANAYNSSYAWSVHFYSGFGYGANRDKDQYIRLVRNGQ